jgi:DNA-binding response OmpR family regulator
VIKVESGDRALERARDAGYSCTILDVMLPGRDGFHVVTVLSECFALRLPQVAVIFHHQNLHAPQLEKNDNPPMCAARPFSMPF